MSLAADVHDVRRFIAELRKLKSLASVEQALESALASISEAEGAEARLAIALHATEGATAGVLRIREEAVAAKKAMDAAVDKNRDEVRDALAKARAKADGITAKAQAAADALLSEAQAKAIKLASAIEAQTERLGMLGAQIDHGEAKLNEIRAAIAKITGV